MESLSLATESYSEMTESLSKLLCVDKILTTGEVDRTRLSLYTLKARIVSKYDEVISELDDEFEKANAVQKKSFIA